MEQRQKWRDNKVHALISVFVPKVPGNDTGNRGSSLCYFNTNNTNCPHITIT